LAQEHGIDLEQAEAVLDLIDLNASIVNREREAERGEATREALDLDVSPTVLARALGVTRATVYRWEGDEGVQ
jgi:DNA-binding transcriptional regulator YiaG